MDQDRYRKIDEVFQAALDLDPPERAIFVTGPRLDDVSVAGEVERLLISAEHDWELLETTAFEIAAPLLADRQTLQSGDNIKDYRIESFLAAGGMGEVYLACDARLGRKVALKLLPRSYFAGPSRLERFRQEARAASALNHPNILTVHELGEIDGQLFIATEFVDGETLRDRIRRGPLDLEETVDIALQIAGALAAAHDAGIVHRDIKPENIMLRRDGYIKVLDFGLAKLTEQNETVSPLTHEDAIGVSTTLVMGTIKYMSPEQASGGHIDVRSDIFSLGVVLYELIAGRTPFDGNTHAELINAITENEPPLLNDSLSALSSNLEHIVRRCMAGEPNLRYQTCDGLLSDLKNLKSEKKSLRGRVSNTLRKHKFIGSACHVILMAAIVAGSYASIKLLRGRGFKSNEVKTRMLTTSGHAMDPAISPDGKYVAYRAEDAGLVSLRMRETATNNEREITSPSERFVFDPVFTPDGKYLYYEAMADERPPGCPSGNPFYWRQLYRQPVEGGTSERVTDYVTSKVTFSPDSTKLAFIRLQKDGMVTLMTARVDGTEEASMISRKEPNIFQIDFWGFGPVWSPDGKHLVYVARDLSDGFDRIFDYDLQTGEERPLTSQKWSHGIGDVTWLRDSSGILFNASDVSVSNALWRLSYPGGELQRLTDDADKHMGLSLTADSQTLATTQVADYIELWVAPGADASRAHRVMAGRHDGRYGFDWTPDGRVVLTREAGGSSDIWIANADGTIQQQLTTTPDKEESPTVTADGRYIIYQSDRGHGDHIWRMNIDGNDQRQLTFGSEQSEPSTSPDSRSVIYTSSQTGKATPWRVSIDGGDPHQITDTVCYGPNVSHNGRLVACSVGGRHVSVFSFDNGAPVATVELSSNFWWDESWTSDDRALRFGKYGNPNWGLYGAINWWAKPIDGGELTPLTFFSADQPGATPVLRSKWSVDGKDLLYEHLEIRSDIVMMSGFD